MIKSSWRPLTQLARLQPCHRPASTAAPATRETPIPESLIENLQDRWIRLTVADQTAVVSHLKTRQLVSWNELSLAEKRALLYMSYGSWGPRKPIHPEGELFKIGLGVAGVCVASIALFAFLRSTIADGLGVTMNREWQEKSNEVLEKNNANPFRGYNQVQSSAKD